MLIIDEGQQVTENRTYHREELVFTTGRPNKQLI